MLKFGLNTIYSKKLFFQMFAYAEAVPRLKNSTKSPRNILWEQFFSPQCQNFGQKLTFRPFFEHIFGLNLPFLLFKYIS